MSLDLTDIENRISDLLDNLTREQVFQFWENYKSKYGVPKWKQMADKHFADYPQTLDEKQLEEDFEDWVGIQSVTPGLRVQQENPQEIR